MSETLSPSIGEEAFELLADRAARLPELFWPGELAWLSAPGKPENEIRDALAWQLYRRFADDPNVTVHREYRVQSGPIDLVVTADESRVLVGEHKACFGFDGLVSNGSWIKKALDKDAKRVSAETPADGVGYLFVSAAHPMEEWSKETAAAWNPSYRKGLRLHSKGGDAAAYRDDAEAAIATLLGAYGTVVRVGRHELLTARAGRVDISWWLTRVR